MNNYVCSTVSYLIPQQFKHYDQNATITSIIPGTIAVAGLVIALLMGPLSKRFINKSILLFGTVVQNLVLMCCMCLAEIFEGVVVCFVLSQVFNFFVVLVIFPTTMMSVPPEYAAQISAVPTTGKNIGQSLAYCVASMVQ